MTKEINLFKHFTTNYNGIEDLLKEKGYSYICGIDEAGRGALAGPVVVGAAILREPIIFARDSKELTPKRREAYFYYIQRNVLAYAVGIISNDIIDNVNILNATKLGVKKAISLLKYKPDFLLLDALEIADISIPQMAIIKGDKLVNSISVASIIAKVIRDRIMIYYDSVYPEYHFAKHKGYGTKEHMELIYKYGPSPIHRKTFQPIKGMLEKKLF